MRRFIVVLSVVLFGSIARAEDKGAEAVDKAWMKAMKAQSIEGIMSCYATDAVSWFPGETELRGEKAIRDSYTEMFASNTVVDVTFMDTHYKTAGDFSVGWGKANITVVDKASGKTNVWNARFTDVAERRGGKWVYTVDHASAEPGK